MVRSRGEWIEIEVRVHGKWGGRVEYDGLVEKTEKQQSPTSSKRTQENRRGH